VFYIAYNDYSNYMPKWVKVGQWVSGSVGQWVSGSVDFEFLNSDL
jgi:hypothetical protein